MAETVVITVNHSLVLDEPDGGQTAKKKSDAGSKSPGKSSRRWGKGSLFKRTYSDQDVSQRAERPPSGKSKTRKESKEEMLGNESPSIARVSSGGDVGTLRPPDLTAAAAMDEDTEGDKGKSGDSKKLQKQNKELVKTNTQLAKLIETLKNERDSLALDKSKLKGELKSSEKELKKTVSGLNSAKSEIEKLRAKSHKHGPGAAEEVEELQEKVKLLENELTQRDEKLEEFRMRLEKNKIAQVEDKGVNEVIMDKVVVPDRDQSKLEKENTELKEKVLNLENDLSVLTRLMDDQQREEFAQSTSMEFSVISTDGPRSTPSFPSRGGLSSSPAFSSPQNSLSPQYGKSEISEEMSTLQNNLQQAVEEKTAAELKAKNLQTELESVRAELEEVKRQWDQEKSRLLKELEKAQNEVESSRSKNEKIDEQKDDQKNKVGQITVSPTIPNPITKQETQPPVEVPSPTRSGHRSRTSSSGSLTSSSELERSGGHEPRAETNKPVDKKERVVRERKGPLQKQKSRENFTAALAIFKSGEAGATTPKRERKRSETSPVRHGQTSSSPGPSSPYRSSSGRPPIPPSSSTSGYHSRQSSADETGQKSPSRMSTAAKRSSWTVAQRRKSFEEDQPQEPVPSTPPKSHHSRTASSPVVTKSDMNELNKEKAKKEQEKRERELKEEERKRREIEEKRKHEEEEKERQRRENEEKERLRKEKEEKEKQRKRELEEKTKREKEEKEKKRLEELERKRKEEERERARKERVENQRREREERERARKEREENLRREREERERKRKEELEKQRQQREEKRKKDQEAEKERQRAKELELEKKRREEREATLKRQREKEEEKKKQEVVALLIKKQTTLDDEKLRQNEIEKRLKLEEEKRAAEKAAQAATDPLPSKINQHQSPFGSIAMRRAAFEQNASPNSSPPVVLRRNIGSRSPSQRPKSMDIGALMSTPPVSPAVSPTPPRSPQMSSISVKTSKSPQTSPIPQRKEIKEVSVGKGSASSTIVAGVQKPSPPVTTVSPRPASVYITTTSSSPPLRRAKTVSLSTASSLAVSTPDLSSVGTTSSGNSGGSSTTQEPTWSSRGPSGGPRSPLTDKKVTKSVSFSPNLSTVNRPAGILKPAPPPSTNSTTTPGSGFSGANNRAKLGSSFSRLGVSTSEDMKKAQSLQNIPEHSTTEDTPQPPRPITQPAPPTVVRRPRAERAKTTSLSRADTVNLANLISKMQEKEKEKPAPITNGVSNGPPPTQRTGGGRPVSMYGSITPSRTDVIPSSTKPKPHERKMERRATVGFGLDKSSKKSRLLRWCQFITEDYDNISIDDFSKSFSNGLAFCAILHHFIPDKIPYSSLNSTDKARNFKIAFEAAESEDIPSLLDIEDMVSLPIPDWMSVMTYVSFIYKRFGSNGATQQFLL